jgi:hypothetical protein
MEAFARGEVTRGGMAEAGWREIGTIDGHAPIIARPYCNGCGLPHAAGECKREAK